MEHDEGKNEEVCGVNPSRSCTRPGDALYPGYSAFTCAGPVAGNEVSQLYLSFPGRRNR